MSLFDQAKRNRMAENARRKIEGYTMTRNVDQMENIIREVCDSRS